MLYINDNISALDLDQALGSLPQWRLRQAMAHRRELDRRLSAAAYLLLWQGLKAEYGLEAPPEFAYMEGGKPFIKARPDIHFSISHCPAAALCAISRSPIGADIERIRKFNRELAERVLNADELKAVAGSDRPDVEFTRLWTMKESLLKLTGEGIRRDLKSVLTGCRARFATTVAADKGYAYTVCTEQ